MTSQNPTPSLPDIERAALTILVDGMPNHPLARAYCEALTADPAEQRFLRDFLTQTAGLPDDATLDRRGYGPLRAVLEYGEPLRFYVVGDPDQEIPYRYRRSEGGWLGLLDAAALRLAVEVAAFRRAGRPAGDQVSPIGTGAAGYITTSLAAAVAEYVTDLRRAYGWRRQEEEFEADERQREGQS